MFKYIFKMGTYYLIFKKFKEQIIALIVSIAILILFFNIYNDLFSVLKITNEESVVYLPLIKLFLIIGIVGFNFYNFTRVKDKKDNSKIKPILKQHQEILNKKKLKTKTDVILQKYLDK